MAIGSEEPTPVTTPTETTQTGAAPASTPSPVVEAGAGATGLVDGAPASPASASPGVAPGSSGTPGSAPPAPAAPTWLDTLRTHGHDLGTDEAQAVQRLRQMQEHSQAFQQVQPLTPYLSAYAQHAPKFHQWLQQQTQAAPQSNDPWHKEFWNPPEWNPGWVEQYVTVDAEGKKGWAQNTPPEVIAKSESYLTWQRDQMKKMQTNPFEFFSGAIDKRAEAIAQKIVNEHLRTREERAGGQQFINQNRDWLYQKAPDGSVLQNQTFNPHTGQYVNAPVLSQWGQAFGRYVQQVASMGMNDINFQQEYATKMVERDYAISLLKQKNQQTPAQSGAQGSAPPNPQAAANASFLQQNNPPASQPGKTNGNSRFTETLPGSIAEMNAMALAQLKALGIN